VVVRSRLGSGSVFSFRVPLGSARVAQVSLPPEPVRAQAARILVVDDNALVREGLAALLASWGYQTVLAESVEQARHVVGESAGLDLAIVDYRLPGNQTARDALQAIRDAGGGDVPAVIITGDTHPQRIREASAAGYPVIFKPVPPDLLRSTLRQLLEAGAGVAPSSPKQVA
jgi:CheY-like chemotaxis protein